MRAIDFFCGAGGLTKGLQLAGIDVVAGIDLDEFCKETYDRNNSPSRFIKADIREISYEVLAEIVPEIFYDRENILFAGCAPCQSFSRQRKSKTIRPDATVLCEFGRLVGAFLPGYVLVENVPGITKPSGASTFKEFLSLLEENGYDYAWNILDAKFYGVPQSRNRLVLIASRITKPSLPESTHGKDGKPFQTVRDAIERFPPIRAGEVHLKVANHVAMDLSPINLERLRHTPPNGGSRDSWPEHLVLKCHRNGYGGHPDVYGRLHWDRPAPTMTGKCHSLSNGRYGHPVQDRAISLREAAAIQTFPDNYDFYGLVGKVAQQIGNAVPVQLGKVLGSHILMMQSEHTQLAEAIG